MGLYEIRRWKEAVADSIREHRGLFQISVICLALGVGSGYFLRACTSPSFRDFQRTVREVPDVHPTRTILHTGEDGPERLELIYDQYGGLEINLPVYRDGRTVRFLGLDEEHLLED